MLVFLHLPGGWSASLTGTQSFPFNVPLARPWGCSGARVQAPVTHKHFHLATDW